MEKTKAELWDFFKALYEHGSNVDGLQAVLPDWTKSQIEHALKRYRFRAQRKLATDEMNTKESSLNAWDKTMEHLHQIQGSTNHPWWRKGRRKLDEVPKDHVPTLSKVMMYAACFEDHYQGTRPNDPNYSEIYRYLSQLLEGNEPTQLSPGSAAKVQEMLNRIKNVVKDESSLNYEDYLFNANISYLPQTHSTGNKKKSLKRKVSLPKEEDISNTRGQNDSPEPPCPLFEDEEDDVCLEPDDPYYELKKENLIKKMKSVQQARANAVQNVPGLNPIEIPLELFSKPSCVMVDSFRNLNA